jgi:hypothetical protein
VWEDELKPKDIQAISYERKNLHKQSSIADFLYRAELSHIPPAYGNEALEVNQSISRRLIEVKKIINRQDRSKIEERVVIACLRRLTEKSSHPTNYAISEDLATQVEGFVEDENKLLNQAYIVGAKLAPRSSSYSKQKYEPVPQAEIDMAMSEFRREYRKPRYRVLHLSIAAKLFLRDHAMPLHSLLHQLKRLYRKVRYRN